MSAKGPRFQEVVTLVRTFALVRSDREITADTRIDADLGITGDDGIELLRAVEARFNVNMGLDDGSLRSVFGLAENEYLFGSEGLVVPLPGRLISWISGNPVPVIRDLTAGELFAAVRRASGETIRD